MSQQQVTITITAKDGASTTFQAVGKAASGMSSSAQAAARTTNTALGTVAKQAGDTERAVGGVGRGFGIVKTAAAGLVGSAVVGFLSDAARAAAESEVVMGRLSAAVDAAGGSMADLAPKIDAATNAAMGLAFDDEAAASALATLTQQTGDASQAVDLLGLTMDVARGRGVDLETAANAVGKAAAGNVTALQRMGVVIDQGASSTEALAKAQQQFAGQAETYAGTTQGAFDRAATAMGNLTESIGASLGPAQALIGLLPGMSTGFSLISSGVGGLTGAGGIGSLLAMMNPLGLAVGGVALAVGGLAVALSTMSPQAREAKDALDGLNSALDAQKIDEQTKALIDGGLNAALMQAADSARINAEAQLNAGQINGDVAERYRLTGDEIMATQKAVANAAVATGDQVADTAKAFTEALIPAMGNLNISGDGVIKTADDISAVFAATGPAAEVAQKKINEYVDELNNGERNAGGFASAVDMARQMMDVANEAARKSAEAQRGLRTSIVGTRFQYDALTRTVNDRVNLEEHERRVVQQAADDEAVAAAKRADAAKTASQQIIDAAERAGQQQTDRITEARSAVEDEARRQADAQIAAAERASDGVVKMAEGMAEGEIAAAKAAEDAVVAAAQRTADAQVKAASQAARDATRAINVELRAAERAAEMAYNKASATAKRNEDSAKSNAEKEYNARVTAAEDATDREIAVIRERYDGETEDRLVREAEARKQQIIDAALADRNAAEAAAARERADAERAAEREMLATKRAAERQATQDTRAENRKVLEEERTQAKAVEDAREKAEAQTAAKIRMVTYSLEVVKRQEAEKTDAVRAKAAEHVQHVEERTAKRIQAVALETAQVQAAAADAAAIAYENAAARKTAAETGTKAPVNNNEPLDGPVTGKKGSGTVKGLVADTSSYDATMAGVQDGISKFEAEPITAKVVADLSSYTATINAIRGTTVGTVTVIVQPKVDASARYQITKVAALGGTVHARDVFDVGTRFPRAANGRTVLVGEAGPELAYLPLGTQVMPHTASKSKMAAEAGAGAGGIRFYGPVTIQAQTADIAREIQRQFATRGRA